MTSSIAGSTTAIDLEKQVRADRQLTERAFSNLAELEAARIHWLQRVEGARGFGATEHALAARLALLADKRVERGLEIIGSGADWGRKIGLKDGEAINLAIPKFQTSALVEVVVRGWGRASGI